MRRRPLPLAPSAATRQAAPAATGSRPQLLSSGAFTGRQTHGESAAAGNGAGSAAEYNTDRGGAETAQAGSAGARDGGLWAELAAELRSSRILDPAASVPLPEDGKEGK